MSLPTGSHLGPYEIVALLGAGGMGMVYRAHDHRLQRDVAIKVLPPGALSDDDARRRFRREALALAKLSHPNIAAVYDVGEQDGIDYIVMECVEGEPLSKRIKAGPLAVADALSLGIEVAGALEEAHDHGVIHRDLKPANIIMTAKGHAKVLDFGLAKLLTADGPSAVSMVETRGPIGTPLYMSPEQAFGEAVDRRTDLWSLGVVLYESLSAAMPFHGGSDLAVLRAITQDVPTSLRQLRPEVPDMVQDIIDRAMTKDVATRYQSAADLSRDAAAALLRLSGPTAAVPAPPTGSPFRAIVPMAAVLLLVVGAGAWLSLRAEHRRWARTEAAGEVGKLMAAHQSLAAYDLIEKAERYLPGDSTVVALAHDNTETVNIASSPAGATVEIRDYELGDSVAWRQLGVTPLTHVRIPDSYFRWRLSRPGKAPIVVAPETDGEMRFALDSADAAPPDAVHIQADQYSNFIDFLGWVGPYSLPAYDIDRFEVTNRDYQKFVDAGGYRNHDYWHSAFTEHGRTMSWDSAMVRFRDRSGRPGPATWDAGHYPEGQADYPVGGISWYEASAYAAFAGKSLPAIAQWYLAADPEVASHTVRVSNIAGKGLAPVGAFQGVGPFGTYDMAGNVREWAENPLDQDRRFIVGAAWNSAIYLYTEAEALSPFDRSATNGVRCVRNRGPVPPDAIGPVKTTERDFAKVKPASDEVFRVYRSLYAYDKLPLNATVDSVVQETPDWRLQRITFDAAYGRERMAAYLFLPKHVRAPYQTVVFFPSARVLYRTDSRKLGDVQFFDYVVKSGRAVMYPIYKETYERKVHGDALPGSVEYKALAVRRFQDLSRSLEYLRTRSDIDTTRLAYLGVSMGSAEGVIDATLVQDQLKAVVLLDGGFFLGTPSVGGDQADFAPRMKKPVLMVNGRYDFSFSYERSQLPLYRMLGTPAADKRHVVLETAHDVTADRPNLEKEVLGWLDRYLGRVE